MGVHFLCSATGEPLSEGDASKDIKWIGLDELGRLLEKGEFLVFDQVATTLYLKEKGEK